MGIIGFNGFGKDKKCSEEIKVNQFINEKKMMELKSIAEQRRMELQKKEYESFIEYRNKQEEQRKKEFENLVKQQEKVEIEKKKLQSIESKRQLQQELESCSKTIRDVQRSIKEMYQFEPCRQLCELLINIRQNVYQNFEDVQEDLEYVVEAFGINEFKPEQGKLFDAKYHNQVYSDLKDARGKEIDSVYASGFEIDGEVIVKAQVSVKNQIDGGKYEQKG